jgi:hypothetical protein
MADQISPILRLRPWIRLVVAHRRWRRWPRFYSTRCSSLLGSKHPSIKIFCGHSHWWAWRLPWGRRGRRRGDGGRRKAGRVEGAARSAAAQGTKGDGEGPARARVSECDQGWARWVMACRWPPSWKPQDEGMMSIAASHPSVWNQGLSNQ